MSDHLLLGGDNIDLAIAHRIESRLPAHEPLSEVQWNFLVARSRDIKERCLSDSSSQVFTLSIPGRGSNLLKSTLGAQIEREEIESIVLDGFFPECTSEALPLRTQAGLREWALPYAGDSAVTHYLAEFLRDRPRVDAILFNGGSLYPQVLRERLQKQITRWQGGDPPRILDNLEPSLAVARGAAHFGSIVHHRAQRIEAGAARSIYLEVHQKKEGPGTTPPWFAFCLVVRHQKKHSKLLQKASSCGSIVRSVSNLFIRPGDPGTKRAPSSAGMIATSIVSRHSRRRLDLPFSITKATDCQWLSLLILTSSAYFGSPASVQIRTRREPGRWNSIFDHTNRADQRALPRTTKRSIAIRELNRIDLIVRESG